MSHSHSFGRTVDSTEWSEDEEKAIVKTDCEEIVRNSSGMPSMNGHRQSESLCGAVQERVYELRSVTDSHEEHDGPNTILFSDKESETDSALRVSSLDEVPDWIDEAKDLAKATIDDVDAKHQLADLQAVEFIIPIATSETEYSARFTQVDERVVE